MNGYQLSAASCRQAALKAKSSSEKEKLENKARIYDIVGSLSEDEQALLFDTGAFNDIAQGYMRMMFDSWDVMEDDIKEDAAADLSRLFDTVTAKEAAAHYHKLHTTP